MIPIKINGVEMPGNITTYDVSLADIDSANSGRGESGYMTRDRVRTNVASIQVGWENIPAADLTTITNAISGASFPVEFFYGGWKTATMYAGDRSISATLITQNETYWNISFQLVEM